MSPITLLGWFGTVLYLVNHSYISLKTDWKPALYYGGNFAAAMALVISSMTLLSWQAVIINSFWALISLLLYLEIKLDSRKLKLHYFNCCIAAFVLYLLLNLLRSGQIDIAILGWLSAFLFSAGYLLFAMGKLAPRFYFMANTVAASCLLPQLWLDQNIPVLVLEVIWAVISIYGLIQRYRILRLID